ncbi:MAG TPA: hypothetical protein VF798_14400 [Burkholderiaceae bacterium]
MTFSLRDFAMRFGRFLTETARKNARTDSVTFGHRGTGQEVLPHAGSQRLLRYCRSGQTAWDNGLIAGKSGLIGGGKNAPAMGIRFSDRADTTLADNKLSID